MAVVCSMQMEKYFASLQEQTDECYSVAESARKKGYDPETWVEIPQAQDLAARVETLLGLDGIAERIRQLSREYNREEVSLLIAKELAKKSVEPKEKALDQAIRVGLGVLTEGILVAPLEGVATVRIGRNADGSSYASVYYAGPIRSAGGTGQALSVLIADVVRRELDIGRYIPTKAEIERYKEEIPLYKQCQHLQYTPRDEEIEFIVGNCPISIEGEGTEEVEVSGHRNLPRVETNRVRGGACLVIAEGLCQKAPKVQRNVKKLGIDGWDFIDNYVAMRSKGIDEKEKRVVEPNSTYIKEILAGRPILAHPSRIGAFRLRYGRGRTTGLAAVAVHPAAMYLLDEFVALGTQIKIERPGKAGAVTSCSMIEPPIVLLDNGNIIEVHSKEEALSLKGRIKKILDLGEILISFGEFLENNHVLVPGAFSIEWWLAELKDKGPDIELSEEIKYPEPRKAFEISERYDVPLHPRYNLFWHDISPNDIKLLSEFVFLHGIYQDNKLYLPKDEQTKNILLMLCALHEEKDGKLVLSRFAYPLIRCLGLDIIDGNITKTERVTQSISADLSPVEYVSKLAGVPIREKVGTRIGAKMGRPEKAGPREMSPPPHVLFPLSIEGGPQRLVNNAVAHKKIKTDVCIRYCPRCGKINILSKCKCGGHTQLREDTAVQEIEIDELFSSALRNIGESHVPDIKGVQGLVSRNKVPEPLEKGILRAMYGVYVFKDGTSRFDMTDVPLTHFKPKEIGLSVEKARELGYLVDYMGNQLENDEQILELKTQDIVPSRNCGIYLVQVSKFIDTLLKKLYKLEAFYNAEEPEDLIGHLVMGLAPHTSGGVLARLIGYTDGHVGFAHPFFHAAKRRNADGDEDCIMLLLDGLINFSHSFLPEKRGGMMDAPLLLTTRIDPNEIDKEAHNMDVGWSYPLEFYRATMRYAFPREVEGIVDTVGKRIGTILQYEGFGFTCNTENIVDAPLMSLYKRLKDMDEKVEAQLKLQSRIRAVDAKDAAARLIDRHFLSDIIGNLKKFSTQQVRCTKCGKKYRRIPLKGVCTNLVNGKMCENNLSLTVHEKSVRKYLDITKRISEEYGLSHYVQQRIAVMSAAISSTFENDKVKKLKIDDFF